MTSDIWYQKQYELLAVQGRRTSRQCYAMGVFCLMMSIWCNVSGTPYFGAFMATLFFASLCNARFAGNNSDRCSLESAEFRRKVEAVE